MYLLKYQISCPLQNCCAYAESHWKPKPMHEILDMDLGPEVYWEVSKDDVELI